ncbi:hypothetical protein [Mycolicibacterium houstonense]|uniref:hypothetical protein n=1 Tax=Mycolicibacterium houstonense TaxID=146021 RepID=UPI0008344152|nr:hypothetical protein [Mycolicibacterium houstonense]
MGVFEAMRAAGFVVASVAQAVADSGRPRTEHRDYDLALRRAEDALVNAEADREVLEPARMCECGHSDARHYRAGGIIDPCHDCNCLDLLYADHLEDEAWDANEDFDARRSERTNTWMRDTVSPVEGSGDATGGVPNPPSVVPLSEQVDRVADELRAQHQPNWLCDKARAFALMLKTQGL